MVNSNIMIPLFIHVFPQLKAIIDIFVVKTQVVITQVKPNVVILTGLNIFFFLNNFFSNIRRLNFFSQTQLRPKVVFLTTLNVDVFF